MRRLFYTIIFLALLIISIKFSQAQETINIPTNLINIVCVDFTKDSYNKINPRETLQHVLSKYNKTPQRGFYLMFSGNGAASTTSGSCTFTGPAQDNIIYADLLYVDKSNNINWINITDAEFKSDKTYGTLCYIKTWSQGAYEIYTFDVKCQDYEGFKSDAYRAIFNDIKEFLGSIPRSFSSTVYTSDILRERFGESLYQRQTYVGEAMVDPCGDINVFKTVWALITGDARAITCAIIKVGFAITSTILHVISQIAIFLLKLVIYAATQFQMTFNKVLAGVLTFVANLNPFSRDIGVVVWRTLRDLAYIVLVFSALYAGFIWLFEGKGAAFSLIFNIILVALIINFSYAFVKLVFTIAFQIEDGISGGTKAQFGEFIIASLWQGNFLGNWQSLLNQNRIVKPEYIYISVDQQALSNLGVDFEKFNRVYIQPMVQNITNTLFEIVGVITVSLMPLMIAMVISGALAMMIFLFMYRFITIIRLLITSPLAILSLAYPNKGPLGKYLPQFPFTFDNWLSEIVKWAVVIPIFMFMVVLGVVFQQNFVSMSQADVSMEDFLFVFIFLLFWFVFSFNVASGLSGVSANIAKAAAAFPGWALGRLLKFGYRRTPLPFWFGGGLRNVGDFIERRLGNAPIIGWELRKFGRSMQNLGSKVMEQHVLVSGREEMRRDLDRAWGAFINNPNPETWRAFIGAFTRVRNVPAFSEDVRNFAERLRGAGLGILLNQYEQEVNQILGIREVREVIDKNLNNLGTALTSGDDREVRESFLRFLSETSRFDIERIFENLDDNGWGRFIALLDRHQNHIITNSGILPKLVDVAGGITRSNLRDWLRGRPRQDMEATMRIARGSQGVLALQTVLQRP